MTNTSMKNRILRILIILSISILSCFAFALILYSYLDNTISIRYSLFSVFIQGHNLAFSLFSLAALLFFVKAQEEDIRACSLIYFIIGACFLVLLLVHNVETDQSDYINPNHVRPMIAAESRTIPSYYLREKVVHSEVDINTLVPVAIDYDREIVESPSPEAIGYLFSLDRWKQENKDGVKVYWITSPEWKTDINIYFFQCGQDWFVCPETVYNNCKDSEIINSQNLRVKQSTKGYPGILLDYYNNRTRLIFRELLVVIAYYVFGSLLTLLLLPQRETLLAMIIAFPAGCGFFMIIGYLILVLHLPYNWYVIMIVAFLAIALICLQERKRLVCFKHISYRQVLPFFISFICIALFLLYHSSYKDGGGDFMSTAAIGMNIAKNPAYFFKNIDWIATYGLFNPILNSQSYLAGGDFLFVVNEMMSISMIAIVLIMSCRTIHKNLAKYEPVGYGVMAVVILFLFFSYDFQIHFFWPLTNLSISVYILVIISVLLSYRDEIIPYGVIALCLMTIIQARVEGCFYIMFFLGCFMLDEFDQKNYLKLIVISVIWSSQWNAIQMIYNFDAESTLWWSKEKAFIMVGGLFALLLLYMIKSRLTGDQLEIIKKHYNNIIIYAAIIGTIACFCIHPFLFCVNVERFIANLEDSLSYWLMVIAMIPIVQLKIKDGRVIGFTKSGALIIGYIFLIFDFFIIRNSSLVVKPGDSGRRVLFHFVPTIAYLTIYEIVLWIKSLEWDCIAS